MSGGDRLAGRRIVLTGASSGIGLAAALALANEGADLALLARGERGLERAVELAHARGVQAYALPVDVGDREGLEAAVDEAAKLLGGIDVFISNAAATAYGPFSEVAPDDFERTVEVTLLGATHGVRAVSHISSARTGPSSASPRSSAACPCPCSRATWRPSMGCAAFSGRCGSSFEPRARG